MVVNLLLVLLGGGAGYVLRMLLTPHKVWALTERVAEGATVALFLECQAGEDIQRGEMCFLDSDNVLWRC